jgi:hypothetical protein
MATNKRRYAAWVGYIFLLATSVPFLALNLRGQSNSEDDGKFSKESKATSEKKKRLISQELSSLKGHPWAGKYYYGDGLGVNVDLSLAPNSGFVFTWNGCLGLYDLNYGDVVEADGKIRLVLKFPNDRQGFQGIAAELTPVVWGERHYLIPADEIVNFANAINAGFEPSKGRSWRFLLRAGDERRVVRGQPNIPAQYSDYLLKNPIRAQIASIKESHLESSSRITTVVLDVGNAQGVKQGMEFHVYSPSRIFESAEIINVNPSSSEAIIIQREVDEKYGRPSTDWKLSTSVGRD